MPSGCTAAAAVSSIEADGRAAGSQRARGCWDVCDGCSYDGVDEVMAPLRQAKETAAATAVFAINKSDESGLDERGRLKLGSCRFPTSSVVFSHFAFKSGIFFADSFVVNS